MKTLHVFCAVSAALVGSTLSGQIVVGWNFGTEAASLVASSGAPVQNLNVGSIGSFTGQALTNNTTSSSSGYTGASGSFSGSFAAVAGAFNVTTSSAFTLTLTPAEGYQVSLTNIALGSRSTASGPTNLALRTSADDFATNAFLSAVSPTGSWALVDSGPLTSLTGTASDPLTLRIYGFGGSSGASGNWRFDDFSATLSVSAIPEPSTYAAMAGALALVGAAWHRQRKRKVETGLGNST